MDRELVPEHEAERARQQTKHDRVKKQHDDHGRGRVPVTAQVRDQAPALWNGQEHRVEREQKPHERADHREQRGRLVGSGSRTREQRFVIARGLHVQPPGGEPLECRTHRRFAAGGGLDQDATDAPGQTGHFLGLGQRRDRDRAGYQRPDLPGVQLLVQRGFGYPAVQLERRFLPELRDAELVRQGRGQRDRFDARERAQWRMTHERAPQRRRGWSPHRPARPIRCRAGRSPRHSLPAAAPRRARPAIARTRPSMLASNPCGSRASSCSVALPTIPCDSCATELDRL